jgi:hypothetical protein
MIISSINSAPYGVRRCVRTASELELVVLTSEPFQFHRIAGETHTLRRLGMSLGAIGAALGVDERTVRKGAGGRKTATLHQPDPALHETRARPARHTADSHRVPR